MNSHDKFIKDRSLELFAERLSEKNYPGYPEERYFLPNDEAPLVDDQLTIPPGPWDTKPDDKPTPLERWSLWARGVPLDSQGRPLHPWAREIMLHQGIGAVAGKGFYWEWGPNKTGDPVIIRRDLWVPHLLLIERGDTGDPALPGGFFDKELDADCIDTALREGTEENLLIDVQGRRDLVTATFTCPVADIRSTLHAWPETTVARIDLPDEMARQYAEMEWSGSEEVKKAYWSTIPEALDGLFGSHRLLVEQACKDELRN